MLSWLESKIEWLMAHYYDWRNFSLNPNVDLSKVQIVAHRGKPFDDAEENTMESFRQCVDAKIDAIEFDIRFTADDVPVIFHDQTTQRIYHTDKLISSFDLKSLREKFPKIPSLTDMISELSGKIKFFIEIKQPRLLTQNQKEALHSALENLTPGTDYFLISLDPVGLSQLGFAQKYCAGIAIKNMFKIANQVGELDFKGLTGPYFLMTNNMVRHHLAEGHILGTGFIPNRSVLIHEINRGIEWIFTNEALKIKNDLSQLQMR